MKLRQIEFANQETSESTSGVSEEEAGGESASFWIRVKKFVYDVLLKVSEETNRIDLTRMQRRVFVCIAGILPIALPILLVMLGTGKARQSPEKQPPVAQAGVVREPANTEPVSSPDGELQAALTTEELAPANPEKVPLDPFVARLAAAEEKIDVVEEAKAGVTPEGKVEFVEVDPFDSKGTPLGPNAMTQSQESSPFHELAGLRSEIEGEWFAFQGTGGIDSSLTEIGARLAEFDRKATEFGVEYKVTIRSFGLERNHSNSPETSRPSRIYEAMRSAGVPASKFSKPDQRGVEVLIDWVKAED